MTTLNVGIPNVFLITIDALRADRLGCYGYDKHTSPNIDGLASRGTLFLQAITNGGGTPEAFPSIMASVPSPKHQVQYTKIIKRNITIAEVLRQNGYETAAFHSNPYLSRFFHYDKGFNTFDDSMADPKLQDLVKGLSPSGSPFSRSVRNLRFYADLMLKGRPPIVTSEQLTLKAIAWLQKRSGKFFLWLHYMDVHRPYIPPQKYIEQLHGSRINRYKILSLYNRLRKNPTKLCRRDIVLLNILYDASIRYVDDSIGMLLNKLRDDFYNTVFILTADHGDSLGEHGFGHGMLYDEVIRIPLIISGVGIPKGTVVKEQVSSMDIAPTIVSALELKPMEKFQGKALLPLARIDGNETVGIISVALNYPVKRRMISYRTKEWKYIRTDSLGTSGEIRKQELYNLVNDPIEIDNLEKTRKRKTQEFELKVLDYITSVEEEKIKRKIKSLRIREGYDSKRKKIFL